MTVAELIAKLSEYPSDSDVRILLFTATWDGAQVIEHDGYEDRPITDIHNGFHGKNDKPFVALEVPANEPEEIDAYREHWGLNK